MWCECKSVRAPSKGYLPPPPFTGCPGVEGWVGRLTTEVGYRGHRQWTVIQLLRLPRRAKVVAAAACFPPAPTTTPSSARCCPQAVLTTGQSWPGLLPMVGLRLSNIILICSRCPRYSCWSVWQHVLPGRIARILMGALPWGAFITIWTGVMSLCVRWPNIFKALLALFQLFGTNTGKESDKCQTVKWLNLW